MTLIQVWSFIPTIKASETDQFRIGAHLVLGATSSDLCPVVALLDYLAHRSGTPGRLFQLEDSKPLKRQTFATSVQQALTSSDLDGSQFNGHSFRIGAATTASAAGLEELTIKHTQGQSGSTVCPIPVRDNTEDPNPFGGLHLFSTLPHPSSDFGTAKGSHTHMTVGRCGVSDPVLQLRKGVHRTNREDIRPSSKEHRRALISGNVQQSAVAEHASNEMHDIDWERTEVVHCHPHYHQRCAAEALHIRTEPHTMNRDGGPLPMVYNPLIQHPQ